MKKVHWILAPNWQFYYGSLDGDVLLCSFVSQVMYFQLCIQDCQIEGDFPIVP